jgi:hypothetical protein
MAEVHDGGAKKSRSTASAAVDLSGTALVERDGGGLSVIVGTSTSLLVLLRGSQNQFGEWADDGGVFRPGAQAQCAVEPAVQPFLLNRKGI